MGCCWSSAQLPVIFLGAGSLVTGPSSVTVERGRSLVNIAEALPLQPQHNQTHGVLPKRLDGSASSMLSLRLDCMRQVL